MYGCQNWQCSAGDSPEPTAKKYKKTTYKKITNDGVQVENLDPTGLRKILLYMYVYLYTLYKGRSSFFIFLIPVSYTHLTLPTMLMV